MSDTIPLGGDEEELRDLSSEDAQELRNFQEKRRWFEAKLKVCLAIYLVPVKMSQLKF